MRSVRRRPCALGLLSPVPLGGALMPGCPDSVRRPASGPAGRRWSVSNTEFVNGRSWLSEVGVFSEERRRSTGPLGGAGIGCGVGQSRIRRSARSRRGVLLGGSEGADVFEPPRPGSVTIRTSCSFHAFTRRRTGDADRGFADSSRGDVPNARLVIAGDGAASYVSKLKDLAAKFQSTRNESSSLGLAVGGLEDVGPGGRRLVRSPVPPGELRPRGRRGHGVRCSGVPRKRRESR